MVVTFVGVPADDSIATIESSEIYNQAGQVNGARQQA
jgi:hypothetical protein